MFLWLSLEADLANLVNIAAIKAAVEGAENLNAAQLEFAKDRIIMGTERKTMFISEESKKVFKLLIRILLIAMLNLCFSLYDFSVPNLLAQASSSLL